ncbi:hypothetical protein EB796_000531 [Bugula neritina]|uniref:Uncharacterized protein n=1 Tax=Bugula neritina TaxID=10212 RepID=A0A7J7KSX1_BUGNE|nr:hypothetical protein EB796_000531 [Bugula neritina]
MIRIFARKKLKTSDTICSCRSTRGMCLIVRKYNSIFRTYSEIAFYNRITFSLHKHPNTNKKHIQKCVNIPSEKKVC